MESAIDGTPTGGGFLRPAVNCVAAAATADEAFLFTDSAAVERTEEDAVDLSDVLRGLVVVNVAGSTVPNADPTPPLPIPPPPPSSMNPREAARGAGRAVGGSAVPTPATPFGRCSTVSATAPFLEVAAAPVFDVRLLSEIDVSPGPSSLDCI